MKIKDGGKTSNLKAKITEVDFNVIVGGNIEFWITDDEGNESLSYLTMDEAIELTQKLKDVLRRRINLI